MSFRLGHGQGGQALCCKDFRLSLQTLIHYGRTYQFSPSFKTGLIYSSSRMELHYSRHIARPSVATPSLLLAKRTQATTPRVSGLPLTCWEKLSLLSKV